VQNILELDIRARGSSRSPSAPQHLSSKTQHLRSISSPIYCSSSMLSLHACFHTVHQVVFLQTSRFCGFSCDVHLFANDINCLKNRGFHCGARPYTRGPPAGERCVGGMYVESAPKAGPSASMGSDFAPRRKATVRLIYCHRVVRDTVPLFSCHNKSLTLSSSPSFLFKCRPEIR
jgi:hypothetical protein